MVIGMGDFSKNLRKGSSFQFKTLLDERWGPSFLNLDDVSFGLALNTLIYLDKYSTHSISMMLKHIKEYRLLGIDDSFFYALSFKNVWN